MQKLSQHDERRVMAALDSAVKMAAAGEDPSIAVAKAASDAGLSQPFAKRLCEQMNVIRTNAHLKSARGADRAASFPLADMAEVLTHMYPDNVQTKAAALVARQPRRETLNFNEPQIQLTPQEKRAAAKPSDPDADKRHLLIKQAEAERELDSCMSAARCAARDLVKLAAETADYFQRTYHSPFAEVEARVWERYGALGKKAADLVYKTGSLTEKRATAKPTSPLLTDFETEPFNKFAELLQELTTFPDKADAVVEAEYKLAALMPQKPAAAPAAGQFLTPPKPIAPLAPPPLPALGGGKTPKPPGAPAEKKGFLDLGTLSTAGDIGLTMIGRKPKSDEGLKEYAASEVFDPAHEAALNSIKARAMLNDMLVNDPIISGHEPSKVTQVFNQVSSAFPSAVMQPALLKGMIRRTLQQEGVMEPHEVGQLQTIDRQSSPAAAFAQKGPK